MPSFANKAEFDDAVCTLATGAAVRVTIDGKSCWIPQSQIDDDSEVYRANDHGKLVISEWIAIQKGLV